MRWRYSLSWVVFLGTVAVVVYFDQTDWPGRAIAFLVTAVPIAIWARFRLGPLPRDGYRDDGSSTG